MRPGRAGHDPALRAAVRDAFSAGILTTRDIAEAFEIGLKSVWLWTRDLPKKPLGRKPV